MPKLSALAEALQGPLKNQPGPKCSIGLLRNTLDPADVAALDAAMGRVKAGEAFASELAKVLKAHGHAVSSYSVRRHVTEACGCGTR